MRPTGSFSGVLAVAAMLAAPLAWPMASEAQTVTGRASAVKATVLGLLGGTTTVLAEDRKSTRLNSSHSQNSYAVFCLKKKKKKTKTMTFSEYITQKNTQKYTK